MGRAARLRRQGVRGQGVGSGNPPADPPTLCSRGAVIARNNHFTAVRMTDRGYSVSPTGQYRRVFPIQKEQ